MSVTNDIKWEVRKVKELGEQIGYGNMMSLASALWRKMLIEKHGNAIGAFVPSLLNNNDKAIAKECKLYDELVSDI